MTRARGTARGTPAGGKRRSAASAEVALPNALDAIMSAGALPMEKRDKVRSRLRAAGMFYDSAKQLPLARRSAATLRQALSNSQKKIGALQRALDELAKAAGGMSSLIQPISDETRAAGFPNLAMFNRLQADLQGFRTLLDGLIEQRAVRKGRGGARRTADPGVRDLLIHLYWLHEYEAEKRPTFGSEEEPLNSPFMRMLHTVWTVLELPTSPQTLRKRAKRTLR